MAAIQWAEEAYTISWCNVKAQLVCYKDQTKL